MGQSSSTKAKQTTKKGWKGWKGKGNKEDKNKWKGMQKKEEDLNRLKKKRALLSKELKEKTQSSVLNNRLKNKGSRSKIQGKLIAITRLFDL